MDLFFAQVNIASMLVPQDHPQMGESPYTFTLMSNFTAEESLGYIRKT